jgi:hypothetical protein
MGQKQEMPVTNVNRLSNKINAARKEWRNAYTRLWGPRALGGFTRSMAGSLQQKENWQKNINAAAKKITNLTTEIEKINNSSSLQYEERKALKRGIEVTTELGSISKQLNAIPRNNAARRVPLARRYKNLKKEQTELTNYRSKLQKGIALRKKILARGPSPAKVASIVKRAFTPARNAVLYGPLGTRTLDAHRQFNKLAGRQNNYLNNYAAAVREVTRLRRALKRKRNNNNRN